MTPPDTPDTPPLSLPAQIAAYIGGMELVARFAAQEADRSGLPYTIANALRGLSDQVLRAAEVDRQILAYDAGHHPDWAVPKTSRLLRDLAARYGVTVDD